MSNQLIKFHDLIYRSEEIPGSSAFTKVPVISPSLLVTVTKTVQGGNIPSQNTKDDASGENNVTSATRSAAKETKETPVLHLWSVRQIDKNCMELFLAKLLTGVK